MKFRPSRRLIALIALILVLSGVAAVAEQLWPGWSDATQLLVITVISLVLIAGLDLWRSRQIPPVRVERRHAGSLALG